MSNISTQSKTRKSNAERQRDEIRKMTVQECMPEGFTYMGVKNYSHVDGFDLDIHVAVDKGGLAITSGALSEVVRVCWERSIKPQGVK